jgi:hypothetical protein
MMKRVPFRLTTLHFAQRFLIDADTFISSHFLSRLKQPAEVSIILVLSISVQTRFLQ